MSSSAAQEPGPNWKFTGTNGVVVGDKAEVTQIYNYGPQLPAKQVFPTLLKYMMDRSEQELVLHEAIRQYSRRAPLVIVVHGDEFQCHDKFIERMQRDALPRMLGLDAEQQTIIGYQLDIPSSLSLERQPQWLLKQLSDKVLKHSLGSQEEIAGKLASYNTPVLIHSHFLSEHWKQYGADLFDCYLRFWQQWRWDYDQSVVVFACIKYQSAYSRRGLMGFGKPPVNDQFQAYLKALSLANYAPLSGQVLPQLECVRQDEAENWARRQEVTDLCDSEKLIQAIRELYKKYQKEISLEKLVAHLESVISASMNI